MKRSKRTGSGLTVVILVGGITVAAVVVAIAFNGKISSDEGKSEQNQKADLLLKGGMEMAKSAIANGSMLPGETKEFTVAGSKITISASESPVAGAVVLAASNASSKSAETKTVAVTAKGSETLWWFGLATNGSFTWPSGASVTGSVYSRTNFNVLGGLLSKISKDFKTASTFNPLGLMTIGGGIVTGVSGYTFPTPSASSYEAAATTVLSGPIDFNGYKFPAGKPLIYVNGDVNLTGDISGDGTIYCTGTATIDGVQKAGHLVLIAQTGILLGKAGTTVSSEGFFYTPGTMTVGKKLTHKGCLVAKTFAPNASYAINYDPYLASDPTRGVAFEVPGYWP